MIGCILLAGIAMWNLETGGNVVIKGDTALILPMISTVVEIDTFEDKTVLKFYFESRYGKVTVNDPNFDINNVLRKCKRI